MRVWQWSVVPLGIGLFLCIVAFPFTHYAVFEDDIEKPVAPKKSQKVSLFGGFKGWRHGFLPIGEIKRLNAYEINGRPIRLSSGPNPNAQPNWLVVTILCGLAAALCGFVFGFRPKYDRRRKEAIAESLVAFLALGLAFAVGSMILVEGFSWKRSGAVALLGDF